MKNLTLKIFFEFFGIVFFLVSFADVLIYRCTSGKIELIYLMLKFIFSIN